MAEIGHALYTFLISFKCFRRVNKLQFDIMIWQVVKKIWQVGVTFWQVAELCHHMYGRNSITSSYYIIACPEGTYGKDCSSKCEGFYCKNGCNHVNGKCDNGCVPGWHTVDCSKG